MVNAVYTFSPRLQWPEASTDQNPLLLLAEEGFAGSVIAFRLAYSCGFESGSSHQPTRCLDHLYSFPTLASGL